MKVQWRNKSHLKPALIVARIEKTKRIGPDGKAHFSLFEFEDARVALDTMVDIDGQVSDYTKGRIISVGLSKAAAAGVLTKESLLASMDKELKRHRAIRPTKFVLTTSVSIASPPPFGKLSLVDCQVRFLAGDFPRSFFPRKTFDSQWRDAAEPEHTPADYCKIMVSCEARVGHDAAFLCQEALDLFRAFASLLENSPATLAFNQNPRPINKVMLGGLHALHRDDGALAEEFYWYEPNFKKRPPHEIKAPKGSVQAKNYRWMISKFHQTPPAIQRRLKDALLLYVRAFDERDRNSTLTRGWRAVELLLGSGDNCEPVARRCAFLYEDFEYQRQIVDHLRECRNRSAHAGHDVADASMHCFQLQRYFRQAIIFHLTHAGQFASMDEANMFLDLPNDPAALRRRGAMIRRAIKFKTPRR